MHRIAFAAWLSSTILVGGFVGLPSTPPKQIQPYVVITGVHSNVSERSCERVIDEEQWTRVWLRHVGQAVPEKYDRFHNLASVPSVNFHDCLVIAIFEGSRYNSAGLEATSLVEEDGTITFRFENKYYSSEEPGDRVNVFGFFVVPRFSKPLIVQEDARTKRVEPSAWEDRARFEKLPRRA